MQINYKSIGTLYSPHKSIADMPIQPSGADGVTGTISLESQYLEGLKDLDGFSHIYVIYHFHQAGVEQLTVTPFMDSNSHGIFATRAPRRPNSIGLSVLKLNNIIGNLLQVENVDILNETPILDIKPYVPDFDHIQVEKIGWLDRAKGGVKKQRSDNRFA
ncbi:MAG: tRNA (N6-threonylcarbamoyladenosine(37)-N6)-methyltransferase TrmO [Desulfuromusa sp.]|nr:tRNA (N6-threonylcarbamoyladenosine(37)-N6)-methyltransferase TrmO [Desulfuromusa sp.]